MIGGYTAVLDGHPQSTIDLDLWIEPKLVTISSLRWLPVH